MLLVALVVGRALLRDRALRVARRLVRAGLRVVGAVRGAAVAAAGTNVRVVRSSHECREAARASRGRASRNGVWSSTSIQVQLTV
mmetsp:Transcript_54374/g.133269  ORF Transcript_54374/g.133269 Transcript_54374/m.133269 type:complete len:85 (+) Transcript_54374:472-726(+)